MDRTALQMPISTQFYNTNKQMLMYYFPAQLHIHAIYPYSTQAISKFACSLIIIKAVLKCNRRWAEIQFIKLGAVRKD